MKRNKFFVLIIFSLFIMSILPNSVFGKVTEGTAKMFDDGCACWAEKSTMFENIYVVECVGNCDGCYSILNPGYGDCVKEARESGRVIVCLKKLMKCTAKGTTVIPDELLADLEKQKELIGEIPEEKPEEKEEEEEAAEEEAKKEEPEEKEEVKEEQDWPEPLTPYYESLENMMWGFSLEGVEINDGDQKINLKQLEKIESKANYKEVGWREQYALDPDSWLGAIIRSSAGMESPIGDGHYTKEFLAEVDKVTKAIDIESMKEIYYLVSKKISMPKNSIQSVKSSEEVLKTGKGVCKQQAALLNYALKRKGHNSKVIIAKTHAWVRVTTKKGITFDLDPSKYDTFIPLKPRKLKK